MADWIWVAVAAWVGVNITILGLTMLSAKRKTALEGGEAGKMGPEETRRRSGGP